MVVKPPSAMTSDPVMIEDSSDARKTTIEAMSSGFAYRLRGCSCAASSRAFCGSGWLSKYTPTSGVSVQVGQRQHHDPTLRCAIGGEVRLGDYGVGRTEINDRSTTTRFHERDGPAAAQKNTGEIRSDNLIPKCQIGVGCGSPGSDARGSHQYVEPAECIDRRLKEPIDLTRVGHIRWDCTHSGLGGLRRPGDGFSEGVVTSAREHHTRSFRCQSHRCRS